MHFKAIFCSVLIGLGLGIVIFNRRLRVKDRFLKSLTSKKVYSHVLSLLI